MGAMSGMGTKSSFLKRKAGAAGLLEALETSGGLGGGVGFGDAMVMGGGSAPAG